MLSPNRPGSNDLREASIGGGTFDSSTMLFDDTNPALNVSNLFGSGRCVENGICDMILDLIKFIVH